MSIKRKIGVICPSEIAFRRFMPALQMCDCFEYAGVAIASSEEWFGKKVDDAEFLSVRKSEMAKADKFCENFGGKIYKSYSEMLLDSQIDAVYLPLPPALHAKWAMEALSHGKHVFVEKPSSVSEKLTVEMIEAAKKNNLAIHENYMFVFHSQIDYIRQLIDNGEIGDVRLYRLAFGFPKRAENDFRYNKAMGGGALLDCGGYTVRLATLLLGNEITLAASSLSMTDWSDADIFGTATFYSHNSIAAQLSFGMDNSYKCDLEIWGSKGSIFAGRIFTAPVGFEPTVIVEHGGNRETKVLAADDTFRKSILYFNECIDKIEIRNKEYENIALQSHLIEKIKENVYGKSEN